MDYFDDTLTPVGVLTGAFLVLVGLGTLVGTPWVYNEGGIVTVGQLLGALLTAAIGVGLAWLVTR